MDKDILPIDYQTFLQSIKTQIQQSQLKAVVAVNKELILLYWHIGKEILVRQKKKVGEQRLLTDFLKIYMLLSLKCATHPPRKARTPPMEGIFLH